jgi:hypothetical protein
MDINKMFEMYVQSLNAHSQMIQLQTQQLQQAFMQMVQMSQQPGFVPPMQPMSPAPQPVEMQQMQQPVYPEMPEQSKVRDMAPPAKPKHVKDPTRIKARIKAVKPCTTCPLSPDNGGNCAMTKTHLLHPACGPDVAAQKELALFTGELVIKVTSGAKEYPVYRDAAFIGVVPKITDTKDLITALEDYLGKTVRVMSRLSEKQNPESIYTNSFFEILGEIEGESSKESTVPVDPSPVVDVSQKPEGASFDVGEMDELPV